MKKSKIVTLVLITALLASCDKKQPQQKGHVKNVHMRADSTAPYERAHNHSGSNAAMWYYAFRPYGSYNNGSHSYNHSGYYSGAVSERSNVGFNSSKSSTVRGGFGGRSTVSS